MLTFILKNNPYTKKVINSIKKKREQNKNFKFTYLN